MKKHLLKKAFVMTAMAFSFTTFGATTSFASCPHCAQHAVDDAIEELDAIQQRALDVFPLQDVRYEFEAFSKIFQPIVAPSLLSDFNTGWLHTRVVEYNKAQKKL